MRISQIPLEWLNCIGGKSVTCNIFELGKNGIFHLCYVRSLKCLYHHILPIFGNKQKQRVTIGAALSEERCDALCIFDPFFGMKYTVTLNLWIYFFMNEHSL